MDSRRKDARRPSRQRKQSPAPPAAGELEPQPESSAGAPAAAKPPAGLNIRMARAGCFVLQGMSLKRALIRAGYSESTARKPRRNGLTAERCLIEASKLDKSADPRTLLRESRALAIRQVKALAALPDSRLVDGDPARIIPRILETAERWHGDTPDDPESRSRRDFTRRAADVLELVSELQRRGMMPGHENAGSRDTGPAPAVEDARGIGPGGRRGPPRRKEDHLILPPSDTQGS